MLTTGMEAGEIVEGRVKKAAVFGLFCEVGDSEFLVLIPDLSWIASFCSAELFAAPGDSIRAKILAVDEESNKVAASVRAMHPDPWKQKVLSKGEIHQGRVYRHVPCADRCDGKPGYLIEVVPGAFAMLCHWHKPLEIGRDCEVEIVDSSYEARAVKLRQV